MEDRVGTVEGKVQVVISTLEDKADKTDLDAKADKTEVYTKSEVYTQAEVDGKLADKADKTALDDKADKTEVYTKSEVYTQAEVDGKLADKADKTALDDKADKTDLDDKADKTDLDAKADKTDVYTKSEVYTKTEVNNKMSTIDARMDDIDTKVQAVQLDAVVEEVNKVKNAAAEIDLGFRKMGVGDYNHKENPDTVTENFRIEDTGTLGGNIKLLDDYAREVHDTLDIDAILNGTTYFIGKNASSAKARLLTADEDSGVTIGASLVTLDNALHDTQEDIEAEAKTREEADTKLQANVDKETAARIAGDQALSDRIGQVETDTAKGIAKASALAALHPLDFDPSNKFAISAAGGFYKSEKSFALGAFYRPTQDVLFSIGTSVGSGDAAYNVGVTVKLGKSGKGKGTTDQNVAELYRMIGDLQRRIEQLEANHR